ncbi:MAG: hypothetical protein J6X43_06425 [Bacteroidales bacterium]|nr:hypothetical protein [Bacteroidales bacterium]
MGNTLCFPKQEGKKYLCLTAHLFLGKRLFAFNKMGLEKELILSAVR